MCRSPPCSPDQTCLMQPNTLSPARTSLGPVISENPYPSPVLSRYRELIGSGRCHLSVRRRVFCSTARCPRERRGRQSRTAIRAKIPIRRPPLLPTRPVSLPARLLRYRPMPMIRMASRPNSSLPDARPDPRFCRRTPHLQAGPVLSGDRLHKDSRPQHTPG